MAELVLSAFLGVLSEKLASTTLKNIARYKGINVDIKKWQTSLTQIQCVLNDASRKETTNESIKRWLNDLQHLAYDIDDVLDDLATHAMHHEFTHHSKPITSKVKKLIPSRFINFSRSGGIHDKLDYITAKLKDILEEKTALGLRVEEEPSSKSNRNRRLQTSIVHASSIVGRDYEKEALVHKLLGGQSCDQNFSVVPIVGMGGVGKTTLARLLYDEKKVKDHFELKAWVCVSDDFDTFAISKVIFQSVTGENKDFADLNLLQVALRDHLRGKRFLLVLDDVWSESCEDWETLVSPFYVCAPESKVIMTTRKDQLLKKLGCNHLNQLKSLLSKDALSLIAIHALGLSNFDSHLSLKPHAEGIVKKCDGLPLALKALGRLLSTKKDEEYWKKVLDSEIWNLPIEGEIIPALKLSYHDLSARLKQLFSFCSLFPKDYVFDKQELVLLWMGEGFLHQSPPRDSTEESMGHEYFDELLSRSFFQHAPNNESLYVMHDMMNDLATYVARDFFVRLDIEENKNIGKEVLEKYRHMSFVREEYVTYKKFDTFKEAKKLRTFLATSVGEVESWRRFHLSGKVLVDLLHELPFLRVLSLSCFDIKEVPQFIGTLRHLRYLNLSRTRITYLPENVGNLYNLQTLIVADCPFLAKLPNNFLKLKNLRHLDISNTPRLDQMPLGIGELKKLQTLSKIIIGGESGFEIANLNDLENLCGQISIMGLEKVKNSIDARKANFSQKRLNELEVTWSDVFDGSRNKMLEKDVLNELKPRNDCLKQLTIGSYGGLEFPNWVGDFSYLLLNHVSIRGCKKCKTLPPLGQLPLLKKLFIEGMDGVKDVGLEFLGSGLAFPSLEILIFENMPWWEKWSTNSEDVFPCLQQLHIRSCPNLVKLSLEALPSLIVLKVIGCRSGVLRRLVEVASAVTRLKIRSIYGLNDVVWRGVIKYVGAVEELSIYKCNEIRYLWELDAREASKVLVNLRKLKVEHCDNIRLFSCPDSVQTLKLTFCDSVTTINLLTGGQKLKSLEIHGCNKLLEREWGGRSINKNQSSIPMLEYLRIEYWQNLKSIIELNYLVHLTKLKIDDCESLESFPDNELLSMTSLKELEIINCSSLDACFPRGVWPPNLVFLGIGKLKKPISEWGTQNFPTSLVELQLYGGDDAVSSCSQISHLLPSSLYSLHMDEFEKLESVSTGLLHLTSLQELCFYGCQNLKKVSHPRLQHITSLQHLEFAYCPNMMDLPEVLLPSLLSLQIEGCPKLKERCSKRGCYWPLMSHIPHIFII